MKIGITNKLKKIIQRELNINYDNYELYYVLESWGKLKIFLLKDKYDNFLKVLIDDNIITSIAIVRLKRIEDNFPEFKIINLIGYSYLDRKFHTTNDALFNIKKEDLKVDNSFSVFLKLCQFDDFTEEINKNAFKEDNYNEVWDL